MAWLILIVVLLAAALGVLGTVVKLTGIIVFTIVLTMAVLGTIVWYSIKAQMRRWERGGNPQVRTWTWGRGPDRPRDLPSHDDRH